MMFNANEIFEMAVQIERNGIEFYERASQAFSDEKARKLFQSLARAEIKHEQKFSKMRDAFLTKEARLEPFDPDSDTERYLHAMANGHVFDLSDDPAKLFKGNETIRDILTTALGREKDSIVFYLGLREIVPHSLGKEDVELIMKEEMHHVSIISKYLSQLEK